MKDFIELLHRYRMECDMAYSEVTDGVYTQKEYEEALKRIDKRYARQSFLSYQDKVIEEIESKAIDEDDETTDYTIGAIRVHNQAVSDIKQAIKNIK